MMTLSRIIVAIFLLCGLDICMAGEECPDIAGLRASFQQENYITLDFLQIIDSGIFETVDSLTGKLWAGKEGRFRLEMPGQTLVSNGILYWSYSAENKQVLIDSVAGLGEWNPLTLLYDPEKAYCCVNESRNKNTFEFIMSATDSLTEPQAFSLQVAKRGFIPQKLIYYDDNDSRIEVIIERFEWEESLLDSLFIFHAPVGVEVIRIP
jgi:outer membrane lipoprotein-sorting protein